VPGVSLAFGFVQPPGQGAGDGDAAPGSSAWLCARSPRNAMVRPRRPWRRAVIVFAGVQVDES